jgi:hypothetical protein
MAPDASSMDFDLGEDTVCGFSLDFCSSDFMVSPAGHHTDDLDEKLPMKFEDNEDKLHQLNKEWKPDVVGGDIFLASAKLLQECRKGNEEQVAGPAPTRMEMAGGSIMEVYEDIGTPMSAYEDIGTPAGVPDSYTLDEVRSRNSPSPPPYIACTPSHETANHAASAQLSIFHGIAEEESAHTQQLGFHMDDYETDTDSDEDERMQPTNGHGIGIKDTSRARNMRFLYATAGTTKTELTWRAVQIFKEASSEGEPLARAAVSIVTNNPAGTDMQIKDMVMLLRVVTRAREIALRDIPGYHAEKHSELKTHRLILRSAQELVDRQRTRRGTKERKRLDRAWNTLKKSFAEIKLKIIAEPPRVPRGTPKTDNWVHSKTVWRLPSVFSGPTHGDVAGDCAREAFLQIQAETHAVISGSP